MKNRELNKSLETLPLFLRVTDLMPIFDIGRNAAYEMVRSGQVRAIRIGNQLRIPREAVNDLILHSQD